MDSRHCIGDGATDRPRSSSPSALPVLAAQRHSSHDNNRISQASTSTSTTASAGSNGGQHHHPNQNLSSDAASIAFTTADHGVVSVNLNDLTSALGVRRADVVSQRLLFQSRSAPSYRIDRSLLGAALGTSGNARGGPSAVSPTTTTAATANSTTEGAASQLPDETQRGGSAGAAASPSSIASASATAAATPPLVPRPVHYHRRHSTLRGTQLDGGDSLAPSTTPHDLGLGLPPSSAAGVASSRAPPRRGTPPPGGANALRQALAAGRGDASGGSGRGSARFMAGSLPSPLRASGGLASFQRSAPLNASIDRGGVARHKFPLQSRGARDEGGVGEEEDDEDARESAPLLRPSSNRLSPSSHVRFEEQAPTEPAPRDRSLTPGRRSSSTATSRSGGTPTPSPLPPLLLPSAGEASAADGSGDAPASPTSPPRRVHFSEDVIASINVARGEDEYMQLLVVYSRPWYAYVLLTIFGILLGLTFSSCLYLEMQQTSLRDRAISVPFVLFLTAGMAAAGMLVHLLLVWRPDGEEEQSFFEDPERRGRLAPLWLLSVLCFGGVAVAVVCGRAVSSSMGVMMVVALVGHMAAEVFSREDGGDCITPWDVIGCAVAAAGSVLVTLGGATEQIQQSAVPFEYELLSLAGWGGGVLVSGVCWTLFTRQLRDLSQQVSQQFLLTSSLVVSATALGLAAYVAGAVLSSDSGSTNATAVVSSLSMAHTVAVPLALPNAPLHGTLLPCYTFFPDVAVLLGGGLCCLSCWYAFHAVSFYVDHVASAACMVIGAALSYTPFFAELAQQVRHSGALGLWTMLLFMSVVGTVVTLAGAAMVIYASVRYRREVEIRIVVE